MSEIFWPANEFLAGINPLEWQNGHRGLEPFDSFGALVFVTEAAKPVYLVEKVHRRAVAQIHDGIGPQVCAQASAQVEHAHVLARGQIDPNIRSQRGSGDALQNGAAHAGYLKPYFFRAERVDKSCERRKFSCNRHRSSGVAARLRANRYFSSSLRPRTRRIFRSTRAIFFSTLGH